MNNRIAINRNNTDLLYKIGRAFTSIADINTILSEVITITAEYLPIERCMITIYDEEKDEIVNDVSIGYSDAELTRAQYKRGEGIIGTVISTGEPVMVPSIKGDPQFLNKTGARNYKDEEDAAFICVPISIGGLPIGAIALDVTHSDEISPHDVYSLIVPLSIMIAHTVNNRRKQRSREKELEEENRQLKMKLLSGDGSKKLVGTSTIMHDLYDKIVMVAGTDSTVLITGESGTGKELVADAVHFNSARKDKPYVKVNIAALPHSLIESELFGHEKGAFTGALVQKKGRFEMANGGTIFLDEIGDLDPQLQVHLLRVIQEKTVERIGGTETIDLDVRIIAATHQDLEKKIDEGTFRSDLYYRLNVFPLLAPSLRERKADIMLLADYFLGMYSKKMGKSIKRISSDAIDMLTSYHWPGNIRELENCIERAVIINNEDVIRNYHLPPSLQMAEEVADRPATLEGMVDLFTKEIIIDHLKMTGGNISGAAKLLGTTKRILTYKVNKLGIDFARYKQKE